MQTTTVHEAGAGRLVSFPVPVAAGPLQVLAWLPPQYDDPRYAATRFPVMVFLHGEPGDPRSMVFGLNLPKVFSEQIGGAAGAGPMVVLMPDLNGGIRDQQCLDVRGGRQLETDLSTALPTVAQTRLRVLPPGPSWVVTGLSEGGYCAADLALRHPSVFAAAGVEDGYFVPDLSKQARRRALLSPAEVNAHDPAQLVRSWPSARNLPPFWVLAGSGNSADYRRAVHFVQDLSARQTPRFVTVVGGTHLTPTFRAGLPDMYRWAWSVVQGQPLGGQVSVPR